MSQSKMELHPELYPTSIRAYARLKFKEPIPKEVGRVYTWESFRLTVDGKEINIDFEDTEISVDPSDRTLVEVMWKNPDYETFTEDFDELTLDALKNKDIKLDDDLETVVCASKLPDTEHDDDIIEIDTILDMVLSSPYDEFEDVTLINNES